MSRQHSRLLAANQKAASNKTAFFPTLTYGNYTTRPSLIKVGGKTVAEIRPDGVVQKHYLGSRHIYRKFNAMCFSVEALEQADRGGALWLEVHDDESGKIFNTTIAYFRAMGKRIYDAGPQIALPLEQWCRGPLGTSQPRQLTLLEVA